MSIPSTTSSVAEKGGAGFEGCDGPGKEACTGKDEHHCLGLSVEPSPVLAEPSWDSAQTRELAVRACFDCHSNQTVWPWYSKVAPVSWLVQRDVDEGREELNYSEWNRPQEGEESAETVREGSMAPRSYLLTHPEARLTDAELAPLTDGLTATFGSENGGDEGEEGEVEEDE